MDAIDHHAVACRAYAPAQFAIVLRVPSLMPAQAEPPQPPLEVGSLLLASIASTKDRVAFATLFLEFAPRLKSYFMRLGMNSAQAEELVQETMLTVWRKADRFDPSRSSASTWIFAVGRNLRIDLLRRTPRLQAYAIDPAAFPESDDASASVFAAERETCVRVAMRELSADQMEVVRLSFFEEKPHAEIARDLGIPLGTVKSRLRLAMARLRASLGDIL